MNRIISILSSLFLFFVSYSCTMHHDEESIHPASSYEEREEQDDPDKCKPCRIALLVGVSNGSKEDRVTTAKSLQLVSDGLKKWGFNPSSLRESRATKANLVNELNGIVRSLNAEVKKEKRRACYVKIHFQGHGDLVKAEPDKGEAFWEGFRVAPKEVKKYNEGERDVFTDNELTEHLISIRNALKQFDQFNLIVQMDFCYAQGMFNNLFSEGEKIERPDVDGMNLLWAAGEETICSTVPGRPTWMSLTFADVLESTSGNASVEEVHQRVAEHPRLKDAEPGQHDGNPDATTNPKDCE